MVCFPNLAQLQALLRTRDRIVGDVGREDTLGVREALIIVARSRTLSKGKGRQESQNVKDLHFCVLV